MRGRRRVRLESERSKKTRKRLMIMMMMNSSTMRLWHQRMLFPFSPDLEGRRRERESG